MLANLFHAPVFEEGKAVGTSGIGSSEAILLAGLAMKKRWTTARKAAGKSSDKPNLIMGANVQVGLFLQCFAVLSWLIAVRTAAGWSANQSARDRVVSTVVSVRSCCTDETHMVTPSRYPALELQSFSQRLSSAACMMIALRDTDSNVP